MDIIPGGAAGLDGRMVGRVSGGAAFLLCRRAAGLNRHASQWALPGGRLDEGESAVDARAARARRGARRGASAPDAVLGLLDDYPTRSGYVITPVVVWGGGRLDAATRTPARCWRPTASGCTSCAARTRRASSTSPRATGPVVQVPLGNDLIHAPTGAVLVQFRWLGLEGRDDPVAGFEQPVFAWK